LEGGTTTMLDALGANTQEGNGMVTKHQAWIKSQATAKDGSGGGGGGGGGVGGGGGGGGVGHGMYCLPRHRHAF